MKTHRHTGYFGWIKLEVEKLHFVLFPTIYYFVHQTTVKFTHRLPLQGSIQS
jgi:hypothetical protein